MKRRERVYFNTSLLLRAVNPWERGHWSAVRFIDELHRRGYRLVVSTLLFEELKHSESRTAVARLIAEHGFIVVKINAETYSDQAVEWLMEHGYARSRLLDVMHMMIARNHGCRYIAAIDRFMRRHASDFNLVYINYYTGVP